MTDQNTAVLQHWMKTVITSYGHLEDKLRQARTKHRIHESEVVAAGGGASVYRRLQVYTSGYVLRLLDCMAADFPVLKKFVGDGVFHSFVKAYLLWKTPSSYTLYDLGSSFPQFLAETRPARAFEDAAENAMLDLPAEMARLERARQETLRARGTEGDKRAHTTDLSLQELIRTPQVIVQASCLRLLELSFPLMGMYEAVSKGIDYDLPAPGKSYIAVSRKHYRPVMEELTDWQYHFLRACERPIDVSVAAAATAAICDLPYPLLLADLYIWLPFFLESGFVLMPPETDTASIA